MELSNVIYHTRDLSVPIRAGIAIILTAIVCLVGYLIYCFLKKVFALVRKEKEINYKRYNQWFEENSPLFATDESVGNNIKYQKIRSQKQVFLREFLFFLFALYCNVLLISMLSVRFLLSNVLLLLGVVLVYIIRIFVPVVVSSVRKVIYDKADKAVYPKLRIRRFGKGK